MANIVRGSRGSILAFIAMLITVTPATVMAAKYDLNTPSALHGTSMLLCAPPGTTAGDMARARVVVSRRVRHGFGFLAGTVRRSSTDCLVVRLPHRIAWLRWLATDISGVGRFGIGVTIPSAKQTLSPGEYVRYKNDPITSGNARLPVVKVVLGRPGMRSFTAKVQRNGGHDYVGVDLTASGSRTLCSFTKSDIGGLAPVMLDRQVVSDDQVSVKICVSSFLTGFPSERSLDRPLGPREIVADLHSGQLPVPLTPSSLK